jgi:lysozyme
MNITRLKALVMEHEGFRLKVYDDATGKDVGPGSTLIGHPTIGIGRALDTNGVSKQEAMVLFDTDIYKAIEEAEKYLWYKSLSDNRKMVIVSMIFNLGSFGFSRFKRLIKAIERQDYLSASAEMINSKWFTQLPERVRALSDMMERG